MEYYTKLAEEKGKVTVEIAKEIEKIKKEKSKLEIMKKSSIDKITLVDNMVIEMLREVLKTELQSKEIIIPEEIKNENINIFME